MKLFLFSLKSYIALPLTFMFLIDFDLIFIYGFRSGSNIILLCADIQFSQQHSNLLTNRLALP